MEDTNTTTQPETASEVAASELTPGAEAPVDTAAPAEEAPAA